LAARFNFSQAKVFNQVYVISQVLELLIVLVEQNALNWDVDQLLDILLDATFGHKLRGVLNKNKQTLTCCAYIKKLDVVCCEKVFIEEQTVQVDIGLEFVLCLFLIHFYYNLGEYVIIYTH
jgi:hypothetical protein